MGLPGRRSSQRALVGRRLLRGVTAGGLFTIGFVLSSCRILFGVDDLSDDVSARTDASSPDDGPSTRQDSGVDAGADVLSPNLIENPSFDLGCKLWGSYNGSLTSEPAGRNGPGCRVCVNGSPADGYSIDTVPPIAVVSSETYRGQIWVRRAPGKTARPVAVTLRTYDTNQGTPKQKVSGSAVNLSDEWQQITVMLTVTEPAPHLDFFATSPGTSGDCFIVDDAEVVRVGS